MSRPVTHVRWATPPSDFRDEHGAFVDPVKRSLRKLDQDGFEAYKAQLRRAEKRGTLREPARAPEPFEASDPGHPLGHGMPTGAALREDGESHRDWWKRVLRADPCAYCGRPAGTVDHIVPQNGGGPRPAFGLHSWLNYTAACQGCNGSKGTRPLLDYLLRRRGMVPERRAA